MIRPTVEWQKQDWFIEYENDRLVSLKDTKEVRSMDTMNKEELEELTEALQLREAEITDCIALCDGLMDVLEYNESYKEPYEKKEKALWGIDGAFNGK